MEVACNTEVNVYLESVTKYLSKKLICNALCLDLNQIILQYNSDYPNIEMSTLNFWTWYRFGKIWDSLSINDKQRTLIDFAQMSGVDTGDYCPLPDDRSVFDSIRGYEKSNLVKLFSNTELLNSYSEAACPFNYDSLPARRILLFMNLIQIEELLPLQITPKWRYYQRMEVFVRKGANE